MTRKKEMKGVFINKRNRGNKVQADQWLRRDLATEESNHTNKQLNQANEDRLPQHIQQAAETSAEPKRSLIKDSSDKPEAFCDRLLKILALRSFHNDHKTSAKRRCGKHAAAPWARSLPTCILSELRFRPSHTKQAGTAASHLRGLFLLVNNKPKICKCNAHGGGTFQKRCQSSRTVDHTYRSKEHACMAALSRPLFCFIWLTQLAWSECA
jgi:hypothetical protein